MKRRSGVNASGGKPSPSGGKVLVRPKKDGGQQPRPGGKMSTSYRLYVRTLRRVDKLAQALGVDKSDVIELAVRDLAKKEGVVDDPD